MNIAGLRAGLGQLERGQDGDQLRGLLQLVGQAVEDLPGTCGIAGGQAAADHAGEGHRVFGLVLQDLAVERRGGTGLVGVQGGLGLLQGLLDRRGTLLDPGRLHQTVDEVLDLAVRQGAHEAVHRPALKEGEDRRDRLDPKLGRQVLVLIDVDLDQAHRTPRGGDRLFNGRAQLLAGPDQIGRRAAAGTGRTGTDELFHEDPFPCALMGALACLDSTT
jgi:hypothetical protein